MGVSIQSKASPKGKMDALTSLRFFAALFVVVGHTVEELARWTWAPGLRVLFMGFSVSVSFFFLLSGYILAVVYIKNGRPVEKRRFYAARFARIYPLFLMTLVLDTPNLLFSRVASYGWHAAVVKTTASFVGHLFMLQAWIWRLRGIDSPNWSLSVETLFYVSFPFLAVALWRLKGAQLWLCVAAIYLGGQLAVMAATPHMVPINSTCFPLLHLSTFAVGILLARWQTLHEEARAGRTGSPTAVYSVVAVATAAFAAMFLFPQVPDANLHDGLLVPIFCAYIWAFAQPGNLVTRWFSARWLVLLGEASFALYLIHFPIAHLLEHFHPHPSFHLFALYMATCIVLSVLCFLYFETPSRKFVAARLSPATKNRDDRDTAERVDAGEVVASPTA